MVLLRDLNFGSASAEKDKLEDWFIETDAYRRIKNGDIDFILGLKGSGKSSIFKMLPNEQTEDLLIVQANNLQGPTEYEALVPISSEDTLNSFKNLWKIYSAILIGQAVLNKFGEHYSEDERLRKMRVELQGIDVVEKGKLAEFWSYLKERAPQIRISAEWLSFEWQSQTKKFRFFDFLRWTNEFLSDRGVKCWILFDRLDEFFNQDEQKRKLALEALLFSYSDMGALDHIGVKIFLRTDIYDTLRFENKDHFSSSTVRITWGMDDLLKLISKRLAQNQDLLYQATGVGGPVDITPKVAENVFYTVFEDTVERGSRQSKTLPWVYKRILNGQNIATPRDMIVFCIEAKNLQAEYGHIVKPNRLISGRAVKSAFPRFSEQKLTDYLYAVFPETKPFVEKLKGADRPKFSIGQLKLMFQNGEDALVKIRKLYEVGVLGKIGERPVESTDFFEVPLMYRQALGIRTVGPIRGA